LGECEEELLGSAAGIDEGGESGYGLQHIIEGRYTRGGTASDTWLLTGYMVDTDKKEATGTIAKVNSLYGYAPEFAGLQTQVGAVIASIQAVKREKTILSRAVPHGTEKIQTKEATMSDQAGGQVLWRQVFLFDAAQDFIAVCAG
jgi:hypothetical protein